MSRLFRLQPSRPDRAFHGLVYYRWTEAYVRVIRALLEHATRPAPVLAFRDFLARRLERTHHAKVVPSADARRIITVNAPIEWRNLERAVPYPVARDIVLDSPATITVAECACRATAQHAGLRSESCGPIDVCLYIGDPVASFVAEHQQGARLSSVEEALEIVDAAARRGNVHTLWFKDAAGGRMYALCNCCGCCCIGMKVRREGYSPLAGSGFSAEVNEETCTGCGVCVRSCQFGAIALDDSAVARVDSLACLGCGVCANLCPNGSVSLEIAGVGVEPLPFDRDLAAVD